MATKTIIFTDEYEQKLKVLSRILGEKTTTKTIRRIVDIMFDKLTNSKI